MARVVPDGEMAEIAQGKHQTERRWFQLQIVDPQIAADPEARAWVARVEVALYEMIDAGDDVRAIMNKATGTLIG